MTALCAIILWLDDCMVATQFQIPIKHASLDVKALLDKGFQFPKLKTDKNNASTLLKRLMGKDLKPDKVRSEYNKNATSFIGLEDFLSVIKALGKKQDPNRVQSFIIVY